MLTLGIITALAFGLFAWFRPKQAAFWIPAILPAYVLRTQIGPLPTSFLELAVLATAICVTAKLGSAPWKRGFVRSKPWHAPAALWIIATIIAIFVAPDRIAALGLWRAYVLEPMAFALLLSGLFETDEDRNHVIRSLILAVIFVAAYATFQFATGLGIPHPWNTDVWTRRATGPFPFPNAVSLFCAPIAALCFGLRKGRIFPWLGFLSGTLATILAKSVGGFLGILAAVLLVLLWEKRTRIKTIGVVIVAVIALLAVSPVRTKIVRTLSFNEWSGQVRVLMWRETLQMLHDTSTPSGIGRPIFGAGLGGYPTVFKPYHRHVAIEIFQFPHNILLNLWSETGVLGILAFGWIAVTWIRQARRKGNSSRVSSLIFCLPLVAILVQGLVDVPYFKNDLAMAFWMLVAML